MDTTKYAELNQSLDESERQLYEKISEECVSSFEYAIHDSVLKISKNAGTIAELVGKIQACKDTYVEASEVVEELSVMTLDTEKSVKEIHEEFIRLKENTGCFTNTLFTKVEELSELSSQVTVRYKEHQKEIQKAHVHMQQLEAEIHHAEEKLEECIKQFSSVLLQNTEEVENLIEGQKKWKSACENLVHDISEQVAAQLEALEEKHAAIHLQLQFIDEFQNRAEQDFLTLCKKQEESIEKFKKEQGKLRKMWSLGIVSAVIIIILQIVNMI